MRRRARSTQVSPVPTAGPAISPTNAQLQVLSMLVVGFTSAQIATRLGIHQSAVWQRLSNMRARIGATTNEQAVATCLLAGWLPGTASGFPLKDWPDELLRTAHKLYVKHDDESDVVLAGEREYQRRARRRQRSQQAAKRARAAA